MTFPSPNILYLLNQLCIFFQKHDDDINRELRAACSKTGGGLAPDIPEMLDGDKVEPNMLDPTGTPWSTSYPS